MNYLRPVDRLKMPCSKCKQQIHLGAMHCPFCQSLQPSVGRQIHNLSGPMAALCFLLWIVLQFWNR
jgi:hypothetical protein